MGTSSGRTSAVFHISSLHSRAAKELSDSGGQGGNVDDFGGLSADGARLDMTSEDLTGGAQEILVKTGRETESVSQFVENHVDVLFVEEDIGARVNKNSTVK